MLFHLFAIVGHGQTLITQAITKARPLIDMTRWRLTHVPIPFLLERV